MRNCASLRELMITVTINPAAMPEADLPGLRASLISLFSAAFPTREGTVQEGVKDASHSEEMESKTSESDYCLVSLQLQHHSGLCDSPPDDCPLEVLLGRNFLLHRLRALQYRVSSTSFFQVNAPACEKMLDVINEWALLPLPPSIEQPTASSDLPNDASSSAPPPSPPPSPPSPPPLCHSATDVGDPSRPVLLDVCSGTGTIGLALASAMHAVVGLEIVESAVNDARINAEQNGITNAKFICGRAELSLPSVIRDLDSARSFFAVLDPPRSGLPRSVAEALRQCPELRRLIYIACNPHSMGFRDNITWLTSVSSESPRKKRKRRVVSGVPFRVVRALVVDMFPHTPHCELLLLLER